MFRLAILCLFAGCAVASYLPYAPVAYRAPVKVVKVEKLEAPEPYEFNYEIKDEDGNLQSRKESGDANGNKEGSYEMQSIDGLRRWVQYWADANGVRMKIVTNEPGTDDQDPADVDLTMEETPKLKIKVKPAPAAPKYKLIKVPAHAGYGQIHPGYGGYGKIHPGYGYGR